MSTHYLDALCALRDHYDMLGRLAEQGHWEELTAQLPASSELILAEKRAPAPASGPEKLAARALLQHILATDARIRLLLGARQNDMVPLLSALDGAS